MSLFLALILLLYLAVCALHVRASLRAPQGYQDATGFHYVHPSQQMPETPIFPPPAESPQRNYFCSVIDDSTGGIAFIGEFKAPFFDVALEHACARARQRCPAGDLRITSVVEQPDISIRGPVSIALEITRSQPSLHTA